MSMRIMITGATGVVGKRVIPILVREGHDVTAIGRTPEKRARLEQQGASPIALDLFDREAVYRAVRDHQAVINLATHMPTSSTRMMLPGAFRENDRLRREAAHILVEAAIVGGVERFVQESFALTYEDRGDEWIDETYPLRPGRYNRTVLDAEKAAQRFTEAGRQGVVLRFAGFYGPDSWMLREILGFIQKGWAPLPSDPDAFMSSISHDDAATAVVAALALPPGTYNVVDDKPLRRREFYDALADVLGVRSPQILPAWMAPLFGSMGKVLSRSVRMSNRKLRDASSWAPRYPSVREGFRAMAAELRER